jgi:hypothetical protein
MQARITRTQYTQPRRDIYAMILATEERYPLSRDDRPVPFELPAAALK